MKTGRSKLMLKLVEETSKNSKSTGFTHDERMDEEDCIPGTPECHSLLPPGARNVIEEMNDICEDVFLDDVHGTSEIIKSTNENMDPNIPSSTCVLEEDPFMAVYENASSSYLLASENQHGVVSLLNITSDLTPLNTSTLISDLSPFPQPITPTVDNNGHGQTPMPSPVKTHVNNKVTWTSIKEVCVDGTQSSKIRYKYALSDDYMTLVLRKRLDNTIIQSS
ncbi:unnamed protein product [Parnassius apollo]|uniref:(apollo) hypothetical protein n=1 Tax=Parnassius apollo TaxID=110799 RepID=A0A8S3XTN1_PARAO|nr:unnamed protein product [Parnassius apollo]